MSIVSKLKPNFSANILVCFISVELRVSFSGRDSASTLLPPNANDAIATAVALSIPPDMFNTAPLAFVFLT